MGRAALYMMELLGLIGMIGIMSYIAWTKMLLGAALSMVGAFFPRIQGHDATDRGSGKINMHKIAISMVGGVRVLVVIGGIILIVGAVLDGHTGYVEAKEKEAAQDVASRQMTQQQMDAIIGNLRSKLQKPDEALSRQQIDLSIAKLDASLGSLSSGTARGSAAADLVRNEQEPR